MGSHAQRMAQNNALVGAAYDFKPMKAIEALRAGETKGNRFTRRVRLDKVPDWAMPTVCANPQGTVKLPCAARCVLATGDLLSTQVN